jgi:peptide-methionine (R)-S-oxide reductase
MTTRVATAEVAEPRKGPPMGAVLPSDPAEREKLLRERLSPMEFEVTQCSATERAFTGKYWDCHDDGTYHCIVCEAELFSSETKFDSTMPWPPRWMRATA